MSKSGSLKASVQKKRRESASGRLAAHPAAAATLAAATGEPETRRLNVNVPADLYDRFREKVAGEGRTLTWVVTQWLEAYVDGE